MHPNVTLDQVAPAEFEVYLRDSYMGIIYQESDGFWEAVDNSKTLPGEEASFETKDEALNWLLGR